MVSIAGSARYLISPVLAGALLAVSDMRLLLLIDICTFFPTVIGAAVVRKEICRKGEGGRRIVHRELPAGMEGSYRQAGDFDSDYGIRS